MRHKTLHEIVTDKDQRDKETKRESELGEFNIDIYRYLYIYIYINTTIYVIYQKIGINSFIQLQDIEACHARNIL